MTHRISNSAPRSAMISTIGLGIAYVAVAAALVWAFGFFWGFINAVIAAHVVVLGKGAWNYFKRHRNERAASR